MIGRTDDVAELRKIVALRDMVYEAHVHKDVAGEGDEAHIVEDGFDLELYGAHDNGHSDLRPGCSRCRETYADLHRIAVWIMPTEYRPAVYDIESFDDSLHSPPSREPRFEVELRIRIRHRRGWDQPIDESERRCLDEMQSKLRELGVRRR